MVTLVKMAMLVMTLICSVTIVACGGGSSKTATDVPSYTLGGIVLLVPSSGSGWEGTPTSGCNFITDPKTGIGRCSETSAPTPQPPPCAGSGGYSDLREGSDVVVKDDQSNIVGVGHFGAGTGARPGTFGVYAACQFGFSVTGLPRRSFYVVSAGTRGGVTYSFDQLQSASWTIALTIGNN